MIASVTSKICAVQLTKNILLRATPCSVNQIREHNKHWSPKWKSLRARKVVKVELPDTTETERDFEDLTDEEVRMKLKKAGLQPPRPWVERPLYMACTNAIFEPYIPPEGDGKISLLSTAGAKQKLDWLKKKGTSWKELRKIRRYDEEFELYPDFIDIAEDIYKQAHFAMAKRDKDTLIKYATERAYVEMIHNTENRTINWNYIQTIESPRVAHIRTTYILNKDNTYAQITVRFHTQQTLAIYDRFGRLMYGSEITPKDVLEYVVFEKHLVNQHSKWRLHHKIIPDWLPAKTPTPKTYMSYDDDTKPEVTSEPVVQKPRDDVVPQIQITQ